MLASVLVLLIASVSFAEDADKKDVAFFESKIRPVLVKHCYECHSAEAKQVHGGLKLDTRHAILQGGDSGAVLVAGQPDKSLLIEAIGYAGDIQMPPAGKMSAAEVDLLTTWVRGGAPLPEDASTTAAKKGIDFAAGRQFWSFVPPRAMPQPTVRQTAWPQLPIDSFVLAALDKHDLVPSEQADRRTLLRRATLDLTGLPPSAAEVDEFTNDSRPDAWERVIDRLLASPQYGERWGRFWLDYARYSDGNTTSLEVRGQAWLYRDWVVRALAADLPYDQFVLQQFAADQLPECSSADLAALGFLGISPEYWKELKLAPAVIEAIVADEWEERIDAIGRTFLGLSIACARCHDHKFDPISTEDYYALAGVLASTQLTERYVIPEVEAEVVRQAVDKVKTLRAEVAKLSGVKTKSEEETARLAEIQTQIKTIESNTPHYHSSTAHGVIDAALYVLPQGKNETKLQYKPGEALDLCVHIRGNPTRLGAQVPRRFLTVLSPDGTKPFQQGSGRLDLGKAILTEGSPLAARVIVNRVWKNHFGHGLVATLSDFGTQGSRPSHPELLDDLTYRFVEQGWSLKWLHRELMQSASYRQASTYSRDKFLVDPDNRWLWRMNRQRLDIEAWRDSLLAAVGNLDLTRGGPPVVLSAAGNRRRTLYAKIDRADVDDVLRLFDFPDPATHSPDRAPTTTPLQQLFVLNSPFMQQQASALAELLMKGGPDDSDAIIQQAYSRLFFRQPSATELRFGVEFLGPQAPDAQRLREYALALLGTNEFLYAD
ncbi:PSD1 and planctomycete cytochrome C domain-containing protein [Anatilimnocola sp. NA78]|uniref:PSD1 and planctomycete cytochrome C domain-containing protein n=1 Tax=Anatilimnocola sp. NA78 TaxID=3415683 RepID=UPI003CE5132C